MSRGRNRRGWRPAATFGALMLAASGLASGTPAQQHSAAEFDAVFAELDALPRRHGDHVERESEYARLRALLPPGDSVRELRYRALSCGTGLYADDARVASEAQALLGRAQRQGDIDVQVRLHYCHGDALEQRRGERKAVGEYSRGIELARKAGLARLLGEGLELRAGTYSLLGEQALALLDFMDAQRVYEQAGLNRHADANMLGLGIAYRRMGDFDLALIHLRRSERAARINRDTVTLYTTLLQQGYLHHDRDDAAASLKVLQQALELAERENFARDAAMARIALAASHSLAGEYAQALALLDRAQKTFEALGASTHMSLVLDQRRGESLAGLGRHREAIGHFDRVGVALAGSDNLRYRILLHRARAASLEALDRMPEALAEYRQLLESQVALDRITRGQLETLMRHQFDVGRRENEHRRLAAEKALQEAQLQAGLRARHWQWVALAAGAALLLVLTALGLRQRRRGRNLHALAMTDPLTGAANRRSLERFAAAAIDAARPPACTVSVVALDVDHFKRINDLHGHAVGDDVLRRVAEACQRELRQCDLLGRTGGEEFVAVLPGTSIEAAQCVAQRLLAAIEALELDGIATGLVVTASLGVAEFLPADNDFAQVLQRADAALYRAKRNGRNRIECDDGARPAGEPVGTPDASVDDAGGSAHAVAPASA